MIQCDLFSVPSTPRHLPVTCAHDRNGPCPYVSCRHHLLVTSTTGATVRVHPDAIEAVGHPDIDSWSEDDVVDALASLPATCSVEVADAGALEQHEIARFVGIKRQQVGGIEETVIQRLQDTGAASELGKMLLEMENEE